MMFFSKLPLVFLVAILGTSFGAWNGYPYPSSDGSSGYFSTQPNGPQINPSQIPDGAVECFCQPHKGSGYLYPQPKVGSGYPYPQSKEGSGYPYSQIYRSSGYSSSPLNKGIGFGYPYLQSS
ncbi:hypothetical protein CvBV-C26_4 [Cotesia vestalis bracovirus]|nr:hypothetical protein CvBV-C26_4 [Cotesia vestalis bracovirus]QZB49164.1 BV-like protein [Cotesia vestalis bracovirus]